MVSHYRSVRMVWIKCTLNHYLTTTGTSLTLYGDLAGNTTSKTAAYQVDETEPVIFPISTTSSVNLSNQPLFTASLSPGEHTVTVALNGSQSGQLNINYFLVTSLTQAEKASVPINGSSSGDGSSSGNGSSSSNGVSSNAAGHSIKAPKIKAIILGSVIPVIFLVILFSLIWLRGRRRGRKAFDLLAAKPFASEKPDSLMQLRRIITGAFS